MTLDLSKIKKIFFIGIGGIGISALAKMAVSRGMEVVGVNDEESPKTLEPLRELGIKVFLKTELPAGAVTGEGADLYVYSDAWLYRGPEILEEAKATGKPVLNYFEALGEFAKDYKVIAIAGTHGKTTTTSMVAKILVGAGLDPTVIVGSFIKEFNSNFRRGESKYLVVEADEYNRHFLSLQPYLTVVTNIEADHLDYYKDIIDVKSAFAAFILQSENKITDYDKYLSKIPKLAVPGQHNRMDAAAAFAVADFLHIKEDTIVKALGEFSGAWRRLEKRAETKEGAIIYDDYAHHPTEIKASLQGLRELYPKSVAQAQENPVVPPASEVPHEQDFSVSASPKKITVVFQPHLYSRTKALFDDFATSFGDADLVVLLPIYFARENKDESISSDKLAQAIASNGKKAKAFPDFGSAENYINSLNLGSKDVLVTMGAGEAYKVADRVFGL